MTLDDVFEHAHATRLIMGLPFHIQRNDYAVYVNHYVRMEVVTSATPPRIRVLTDVHREYETEEIAECTDIHTAIRAAFTRAFSDMLSGALAALQGVNLHIETPR